MLLLLAVGGCAAYSGAGARVEPNAAFLQDHRRERLLSVAKRFGSCVPDGNCDYQVVDRMDATAFAWPDGRIHVTRGLVDLLDDEELAAAVAHELGHLLDDGHLTGRFSLKGTARSQDAEARADVIGRQLLRQAGLPHESMKRMLEKVLPAHRDAAGRASLARRIERLAEAS